MLLAARLDFRDFGARGDGVTKDTAAIQHAIDAAERRGGGTVEVPPGRYLSGTIHLKSNVTLYLDNGATILASTDNADFDRDGRGDPCDPDSDGDGVLNAFDNCPSLPNPDQVDHDQNGLGFACDPEEQSATARGLVLRSSYQLSQQQALRIPIPICPTCGAGPLPPGFSLGVSLQSSASLFARVVDAEGTALDNSAAPQPVHSFRFRPKYHPLLEQAGILVGRDAAHSEGFPGMFSALAGLARHPDGFTPHLFLGQAYVQFELWTGQRAPRDVMRRVVESRL